MSGGFEGIAICCVILGIIAAMFIKRYTTKQWVRYTINKDEHYSDKGWSLSRLRVRLPWRKRWFMQQAIEIKFQCYFSESATIMQSGWDGEDINKLYGISLGNIHKNSARLGWRADGIDNEIRLYGYVYQNGERDYDYLLSVEPNEVFTATITVFKSGKMWFNVKKENGDRTTTSFPSEAPLTWYQWMFNVICLPYFGGNLKAPTDIYVWIKR